MCRGVSGREKCRSSLKLTKTLNRPTSAGGKKGSLRTKAALLYAVGANAHDLLRFARWAPVDAHSKVHLFSFGGWGGRGKQLLAIRAARQRTYQRVPCVPVGVVLGVQHRRELAGKFSNDTRRQPVLDKVFRDKAHEH